MYYFWIENFFVLLNLSGNFFLKYLLCFIANINYIEDSTTIIDTSFNWNILFLKEAIQIRKEQQTLNTGLKVSRDLFLFSFR